MKSRTLSEKILSVLIRLNAVLTMMAVVPLFLPRSWMAETHEWLGLGAFPEGVIVMYLARSLCAFYFLFGVLLWIVGGDVRRYRHIVTFTAVAGLGFGLVMFVVDLRLGLPASWTWSEGPPLMVYGALILFLRCRIPPESSEATRA